MSINQTKQMILDEKLVVIARRIPFEKAGLLARALVRGGVKLLEVTFDQLSEDPLSDYRRTIEEIRASVGDDLHLGAGTVLTVKQVETAHDCGARFILSPNVKECVIGKTKELGMVSIPGAMTPSEIVNAWDEGADIIKLFPADDLGYHYIWNLQGPLPHIPLLATGGVNPDTIPKFFEQGVCAVGTGASIIQRKLLDADDYSGIEELARKHIEAIRGCR